MNYLELQQELERLMDSPEVVRYFEVLRYMEAMESGVNMPKPTLAEMMRFKRQSLGLSQSEYDDHIGYGKGVTKRIESGAVGVSKKQARRLYASGYSADFFLA